MDRPSSLIRTLRRWRTGVLTTPDRVEMVRTVIDPANGHLVFCAGPWLDDHDSLTVQVPEESTDSTIVGLSPTAIDDSAPCDRWRIYHGSARASRWFSAKPDWIKHAEEFEDEPDLRNPLAADEAAICKSMNTDRAALRRLVRGAGESEECTLVGVDAWGVDLRTRFAIVRREFDEPASNAGDADSALRELIEKARDA